MAMSTLKDVYFDELQDLYSANSQALEVVGELGQAAKDRELSEALIAGGRGISAGIETLASLCSDHGLDPTAEKCRGMEGLVKEARLHALEEEFGDDAARDATIIAQYQRMTHYAIAGYGSVVAFANRLGFDGDAAKLKHCLEECYGGDRHMTKIATQGVNARAA